MKLVTMQRNVVSAAVTLTPRRSLRLSNLARSASRLGYWTIESTIVRTSERAAAPVRGEWQKSRCSIVPLAGAGREVPPTSRPRIIELGSCEKGATPRAPGHTTLAPSAETALPPSIPRPRPNAFNLRRRSAMRMKMVFAWMLGLLAATASAQTAPDATDQAGSHGRIVQVLHFPGFSYDVAPIPMNLWARATSPRVQWPAATRSPSPRQPRHLRYDNGFGPARRTTTSVRHR